MNIQEENSALYFRVQSEREQTLVPPPLVKDGLQSRGAAAYLCIW